MTSESWLIQGQEDSMGILAMASKDQPTRECVKGAFETLAEESGKPQSRLWRLYI